MWIIKNVWVSDKFGIYDTISRGVSKPQMGVQRVHCAYVFWVIFDSVRQAQSNTVSFYEGCSQPAVATLLKKVGLRTLLRKLRKSLMSTYRF